MSIKAYLERCQRSSNAALKKLLPPQTKEPKKLHQAMRYSVLNGGKRIRAALVYATGEALGAHRSVLDQVAAAIEMIHAFSLIHDDLPAIDNDDLRRGKPTSHIAFGEATAILAGDALQCLPFEILASLPLSADTKINMIHCLANMVGSKGLIGGEEWDVKMVGKKVSVKKIEQMYYLKTACLLTASIQLGAMAAQCKDKNILNRLKKFGDCMGVAFQIHDDIIGACSSTALLGKKQGADLMMDKPVYHRVVGLDKAKKRETFLYHKAIGYLDQIKTNMDKLKEIADFIIQREY